MMMDQKIEHYLEKFRRAKSLETLDRQAELADMRNPEDNQAINEAWIIRWRELRQQDFIG